MADKDKTQAVLLDLIRKSREQELLFLHTIRDAAILAGEQVQDKRLDLLENPPDVDANSFLTDFLIALALGPGVGLVIKAVTARGMRAILRNRSLNFDVTDEGIKAAETVYAPKTEILARNLLDKRKKEFELWTKMAEDIEKVGVDVTIERLKRVTTTGKSNSLGGDTASVAIRRAALSFVRLQEPVVVLIHEHYKDQVQSGDFDFTAETFISFLTNNLKFSDPIKAKANSELERSLSLFFEACIWLLHFAQSGGISQQATETETIKTGGGPSAAHRQLEEFEEETITTVTLSAKRPIVKYWLSRFPHPAGDGVESFAEYSIKRDVANYPDNAIEDLLKWFKDIEKGIVNLQQLGVVGLEVLGPVKIK